MRHAAKTKHLKKIKEDKKANKLPAAESYRPRGQKRPKFLVVLKDWQAVTKTVMDDKKHGHVAEYVLAPNGRCYRKALSWENPTLVIDSPIFVPMQSVRLVRIKDSKIIKEVRRAVRRNRSR